jgi:hypothetical protein
MPLSTSLESFCAQSLIVQNSSQTTLTEPVMHHVVHAPATSLLEHVFSVTALTSNTNPSFAVF